MEIVWIIILSVLIYLVIIFMISCMRALFSLKGVKDNVKKKFSDTFWHFFIELLNPFNWV